MHTSIHQDHILKDTSHLVKISYYHDLLHFIVSINNLYEILSLNFKFPYIYTLCAHQFINYQPIDLIVYY